MRLGTYEFEEVPVEHVVIGEVLAMEEVAEQLSQVRVVGLIFEPQAPAERQVSCEFVYKQKGTQMQLNIQ